MKELIVSKNDSNQRIDRFLKKYMPKSSKGFLYKMLRKKRIKLNGKRANPEDILDTGDKIQLYLAPETIEKFQEDKKVDLIPVTFDIIYEDDNILLINKPKGLLSHSSTEEDKDTVVKQFISYLYSEGKFDPNMEKTFIPSICNRLDRNTSGIIIGGKNHNTLKIVNSAIKEGRVKKYYKAIVKGNIKDDIKLKGYLVKDEKNNKVRIENNKIPGGKEIITHIKILKRSEKYSLIEIDLITGRTHQIRAHLASIGHPIIGDNKYGDGEINRYFKRKYKLDTQFLHAYKIIFMDLDEPLDYLNGKDFIGDMEYNLKQIYSNLFI